MNGSLTVGFDGLFFEHPMTGVGQYAMHLWRNLRDHQELVSTKLLLPATAPPVIREEACGVDVSGPAIPRPAKLRKVSWEQAGLPHAAFHGNVDLVHVPYFAAPALKMIPYIVTIHDIIHYVMPEYRGSLAMQAYLSIVSRTSRRAAMILTDSEHSRKDIHRTLDIPLERIKSIPLGVSSEYRPAVTSEERAALSSMKDRLGLARPFILNVGGHDLRKRLPQLIEGYARALPLLKDEHDLVIAGSPHTGNPRLYPPLEPLIKRWGLQDRVHLTGFVSEEDKRMLYQASALFAFTSEYEGFGLDPLEAMASGAPVLCSDRSSLPEVTGDAAILIDPNLREIAGGIIRILNDPNLRQLLSQRSLERAAQFRWERTAQETVNAYLEVARDRGLVT